MGNLAYDDECNGDLQAATSRGLQPTEQAMQFITRRDARIALERMLTVR